MTDPQNSNPPLLGRYQVLSELAKSPVGGLVLALDVPARRAAAVRSLPIENKLSSMDGLLLLEVSKWVKGLDDPAIMRPLEAGTQEGVLHAAYDYRMSEPLRGVMRLASFKGEPMPVGVALRIAHDTVLGARAIEACGAPLALGDSLCGGLLPDSILVGQDGRTCICDAGTSAVLRRTPEYGQQAEVLSYAAPEQLDCTGSGDSRSDVFAVGVLLWEMLANRRLFSALQAGDVMDKVRSMPVPPLDGLQRAGGDSVPEAISVLVQRAVAREPMDRYAGTTALLQALETHGTRLMASPASVAEYVSTLVGNIFETRSRAVERALLPPEPEQRSNPVAVLKALTSVGNSQDLRPRAAPTQNQKSSPKAAAPIPPTPPKTRTTPTPKQRGSRPSVHIAPVTPLPVVPRASMKSSPPVIAALVDDAIAQGEREAKAAGSKIHSTLPPLGAPLDTVPPGLANRLELPGAELFATPGLPAVKPADGATRAAAQPEALHARGDVAQTATQTTRSASEPVLGEFPEGFSELQSLEPDEPAAHSQWKKPPRLWVAVVSLLGIAFMLGLAIRGCAKSADTTSPKLTASAARANGVLGTSSASAQAAQASVSSVATIAAPPAIEQVADAAVSDAADAGVVRKPPPARTPQSAPRARRRTTTAPHFNSKVSRSRGKTTR